MVQRGIHRLFLWVVAFACHPTSAFIYDIQVMRAQNPLTNDYRYFIGCSDFHDKSDSSTSSQRKDILSILKGCSKKKVKILLEDLNSPNCSGKQMCGRFILKSKRGTLAQLTQDLANKGLDVENVEYRYGRVIALSGILHDIARSPYQCQPACALRVASLLDEVNNALEEIKTYSDGLLLDGLYQRGCARVRSMLKIFDLENQKNKSIAAFCADNTRVHDRLTFLKKLLTFDSDVLDFKIVHAVLTAKNKGTVVAFAGGTHIARACALLKNVGYDQIESTSIKLDSQEDLAKCIMTHETSCVQPRPVSLELLQKYLKK